jgi:hypothetical protein
VKELRGSAAGRLDPGMPGHPAGQAPKLHNTVIKDRAIVQKISLPAPKLHNTVIKDLDRAQLTSHMT